MHDATMRQFRAFKVVAEEGSFAKAASRLGVSQPAISKHVVALENKLGFSLFTRKNGTIPALTGRGSEVLKKVSSLLGDADSVAAFAEYAARQRKKVRITAGGFISKYVIVPNLGRLQMKRPDLIVELTMLDSPLRAFEPAQRDATDLAFVSVADREMAERGDIICTGESVFSASPSHPIVGQLAQGAAVRLPMIMGLPGEHCDSLVRLALSHANISAFYATHNVQLPEVMISLAVANEGICSTFPRMIRNEISNGTLVRLNIPSMPIYCCALYNKTKLNEDIIYVDEFFRPLIRAEM